MVVEQLFKMLVLLMKEGVKAYISTHNYKICLELQVLCKALLAGARIWRICKPKSANVGVTWDEISS